MCCGRFSKVRLFRAEMFCLRINHTTSSLLSSTSACREKYCTFSKRSAFSPKYTKRGAYYVVYFKDSDTIVDLLALFGALKCSFDYTDAKIERDIRNNVNRVQNCDLANMTRTANTANRQVEMLERIIADGKLEYLKPELRETANIRINNPEASLLELGELHEPHVTKSCVNHRLKKIEEFYEENCLEK